MHRPNYRAFIAFVLGIGALSPAGAISKSRAGLAPRVHPRLLAALERSDRDLPVIVGLKATVIPGISMEAAPAGDPERAEALRNLAAEHVVAAAMAQSGFSASRYFESFPLLAGRASPAAAVALANRPDVAWVVLDGTKGLLKTSPPLQPEQLLIRSPRANGLGFTGKNQTVAVLDTGVDYTVAELGAGSFPNSKVIGGTNTADRTGDPQDCEGHGTSVAAIIAGTAGIAPDAKIVAVKVFPDCFPFAADSDILAGIDFAIANHTRFSIGAINLSLGADLTDGSSALGFCDSQEPAYATAFDAAAAAGIVVVVASGNSGFSNALSSPACVSGATSVGAVYSEQIGNVDWGLCVDDQIQPDRPTCFSNSNENLSLMAPGAFWNVVTKGGDLQSFSGTSAAAPTAAGAVALLRQALPTLPPSAIVGILAATGAPVRSPGNGVLTPRIDAFAAVQLASASYTPFTGGPVAIPDGSGSAKASVTVSGFTQPLGSVQAWVQIDHSDPTQLKLTLAGPDGTSVVLADHSGAPEHPINTVYGRSSASATVLSAFEGKTANGLWTLTVQDTVSGVAGRIRNFALSLVPGQPHLAVPPLTDGYVIPSVSRSDTDRLVSNDLRLYNPNSTPKTLSLYYVPQGQTGSLAVVSTRTVGAGRVLALNDVLFSEFGYMQAAGQLTITSDDARFFMTSRSFTDATVGQYGALTPGQQISGGVTPGGIATLPALTRQTFMHSDVGFTEVSGVPVTVRLTVTNDSGQVIGTTQQTALPNQSVMLPDPIRYLGLGLTPSYRVDAAIVSGAGRVVPFATTTDDRTGDSVFEGAIPAAPLSTDDWVVPEAASIAAPFPGPGASIAPVVQTDLSIANLDGAPANVTVSLIARPGFTAGAQTYAVGAGQTLTRADILRTDFPLSSNVGALRIHTDTPSRLAVTARLANVFAAGSYALTEQAVAASSALAAGGGTATAIHMDHDNQTRSGFGLVEVSGNDAAVHISIVNGTTGVELGAKDYTVPAGKTVFFGAEDILGTTKANNLYFRFSVPSGSGQVIAYGQATNILSGDAILVVARKDP